MTGGAVSPGGAEVLGPMQSKVAFGACPCLQRPDFATAFFQKENLCQKNVYTQFLSKKQTKSEHVFATLYDAFPYTVFALLPETKANSKSKSVAVNLSGF